MKNYVAIYGFLRTLCLISILLFWNVVWHTYSYTNAYIQNIGLIVASSLLSFVLYMAFVKFYRRFSLEALMALTAVFNVDQRIDPRSIKKVE